MALGHPLHSIFVHFPMACFILGWLCQGLQWARPALLPVGLYLILLEIGLIASIPALVTGLLELAVLELNESQEQIVIWHLTLMGTAVSVFFLGWFLNKINAFTLKTVYWLNGSGVLLLIVGGWFGGELVYGKQSIVRNN